MSKAFDFDTVVVGQGIAGVAALSRLTERGYSALGLEKAMSVGGRMATRRFGQSGRADHGAQFFTAKEPLFQAAVERLLRDDVVRVWNFGFGSVDSFPRYLGTSGMNSVVKSLANPERAVLGSRVLRVSSVEGGYVVSAEGSDFSARTVVLSAPVPQSLKLLDGDDWNIPSELTNFEYWPTVCVMIETESPTVINAEGVIRSVDGISMLVDNAAKGISEVQIITVHLSDEVSQKIYSFADRELISEAVERVRTLVDVRPRSVHLKRWLYATPKLIWPTAWLDVSPSSSSPLIICGEAFMGPRVEGAYNSGYMAAEAVAEFLGQPSSDGGG